MSSTPQSAPPAQFQQKTYDELKKEVIDTAKKIKNYETRPLPKEPVERASRIDQYKKELVGSYNNFVAYTALFYETFALIQNLK